nr:hypothetical protein BaRGS_032190 [Batillaria attramentaria]
MTLCTRPARAHENDDCQLIPSRVNIVKEMTLQYHGHSYLVSCTALVTLNKCEGSCESRVTPSVRQHGGFRRDCRCCKEGELTTRTVTLPQCYHDGRLMPGLEGTTTVSDMNNCNCVSCSN